MDKIGAIRNGAELKEHVVITATDPTKTREGGTKGLPVSWEQLAEQDQHLPYIPK